MVKLLARLWRWFKNKFFPSPPPAPKPTVTKPSNLEYENALLELLEEAAKGKTWENLQAVLITRGIDSKELAKWLEGFGKRWLESPDKYEELALKLEVLGNLAQGDLGNVARRLSGEFRKRKREVEDSYRSEPLFNLSQVQSSNDKVWFEQGIELAKLGKYEEAITCFNQVLHIKSDSSLTWVARGIALKELGRIEEAITSYDQALQFNPGNNLAWYNRGDALSESGRNEEAIDSYDRAIEIQPDYYEALNNRGVALRELGKYKEAIFSFEQSVKIQPQYSLAWYNRGDVLSKLEKYEETITSYDHAIEIQPDYYEALNNRGVALYKLGRYEEAILNFKQSIKIQTDGYQAWCNWGSAQFILKKYEEAIFSFDQALQIQTDFYLAWSNRSNAAYKSPGYNSLTSEKLILSFSNKIDPQFFQKSSPSQLNPELNKRGYEGQLASLQAELDKAICRDTHPEGWGFLHHQIGKAHYHQSRNHPHPHSFRRKAENSY